VKVSYSVSLFSLLGNGAQSHSWFSINPSVVGVLPLLLGALTSTSSQYLQLPDWHIHPQSPDYCRRGIIKKFPMLGLASMPW